MATKTSTRGGARHDDPPFEPDKPKAKPAPAARAPRGRGLSISGPKTVIDQLVRTAHKFSATETGAPEYMKSILIEATPTEVVLTAESQHNAIEIRRPVGDLTVNREGRLLVKGYWLTTALDTIPPDQEVTLTYDSDDNKVFLDTLHQHLKLAVPVMSDRALLPSVGEVDTSNGISFSPDAFLDAYGSVVVARDFTGAKKIVSGVYAETDVDASALRLLASDGAVRFAFNSLNVDIIGDGPGIFLFHPESIDRAADLFKEGATVKMHRDADDRLHFLVNGKEGVQPYHVRLATLGQDINQFPAQKMRAQVTAQAKNADVFPTLDKAEFQRLLRNAASIGALDPGDSRIGGQAKRVEVVIEPGGTTVSVDTSASYEETIPTDFRNGVMEFEPIEFGIKYGLHGQMINAYNNEADPKSIKISVLRRPGTSAPYALILSHEDELFRPDGTLVDYLSMIAVSSKKG